MRYFFLIVFYLFFYSLNPAKLKAQYNIESSEFNINDYKNINLPPMDVLFENAKKNPVYELAEVKEQIENNNLLKEKRAWLNYFTIRGSYHYGMLGNEQSYTDAYTPIFYNYSTAAQNSYSIGAGITIPLEHLFDLRGKTKRQKMLIKSTELEKEVKFEGIKEQIIVLYSNILSQLNILKIRSDNLVITGANYDTAEKNFANGTIELTELTREKERHSSALELHEQTKAELTKNLLILENISRTPIIKK